MYFINCNRFLVIYIGTIFVVFNYVNIFISIGVFKQSIIVCCNNISNCVVWFGVIVSCGFILIIHIPARQRQYLVYFMISSPVIKTRLQVCLCRFVFL